MSDNKEFDKKLQDRIVCDEELLRDIEVSITRMSLSFLFVGILITALINSAGPSLCATVSTSAIYFGYRGISAFFSAISRVNEHVHDIYEGRK